MFFLIDKPTGISSFDVIRRLRKTLGIKKMGHAGTLDPLASGLMLIATDKSTKLLPLLGSSKKRYSFCVSIDGTTETLDLGSPILSHDVSHMRQKTPEELALFLSKLSTQVPPRYSALHIQGQRAYDLARDGIEFTLSERSIEISDVYIRKFAPPVFCIELTISSGGYIRSLASNIADFFGVDGGYITMLRRIAIMPEYGSIMTDDISHLLDDSIGLSDVIGYDQIFPDIPMVPVDKKTHEAIRDGKIIKELPGCKDMRIGQKLFLNYKNIYLSLVCFSQDGIVVIRNDV